MKQRRCAECGNLNPSAREQCAWCGAAITGPQHSDNETARRRFRLFLGGLVVFIVVVVLVLSRVRGVW